MATSDSHPTLAFEGVTPILPVRELAASILFYTYVLGFQIDWQTPESGFASVSRGGSRLFLCEGDQGHPGTWVWIGVSSVTAFLDECRPKGAVVRHPPPL
jgi:catechol 2,3-dioxygenase-like lactoylglutathione lyase family enzyme